MVAKLRVSDPWAAEVPSSWVDAGIKLATTFG
jgi:hypothetical protein